MLAAILATAVLLNAQAAADPSSLVDQLGSTRYALRVAAERELGRLGRAALPALRSGQASKDAEIRTRSSALLNQIEGESLLQATPIGLDLRDVPLPEAIASIGRKSGVDMMLHADDRAGLSTRRFTLKAGRPLPFWEAIDAIASAGGLHPVSGDRADRGGLEGALILRDGPALAAGPVSDAGAFRVQLWSIRRRSEIAFDRPAPGRAGRGHPADSGPDPSRTSDLVDREFSLQFVLTAEPRLSVGARGAARVAEAVDDRGQSLLAPDPAGGFEQASAYRGLNPGSMLRFRIDLADPTPSSGRIRSLRGTIPVLVSTRTPDPIVAPLAGPAGRTFRGGGVTLALLESRPAQPDRPATIQVAIRPLDGGPSPGDRPDSFERQVEVLDASGRPMPWFPSHSFYAGGETRMTIAVGTRERPGDPATLRFHGLRQATADVAFEFRDIPIP